MKPAGDRVSGPATTRVFYAGRMRTLVAIERRRKKNREWGHANDHLRVSFLGFRTRMGSEEAVARAHEVIGSLVAELLERERAEMRAFNEQLNERLASLTPEELAAEVAGVSARMFRLEPVGATA